MNRPSSVFIRENLQDCREMKHTMSSTTDNFIISRHLLLLYDNCHSLQILLDDNKNNNNSIGVTYDDTFVFGSEFTRDKSSEMLFFDNLSEIMNCMRAGKTVILYNLNEIHESLYDMLNQRYTKHTSGRLYCRVALGAESRACYVDHKFKCIVIAHKNDAYGEEIPV